ncbi:hypothetical protein Psi02_49490 [Planotetraspora silvatica]|uniref:RDD domain-containing protein n=1 Tax=Planotetraspora silvatica TaxID=234614 RepID=A0A8J3V1Z9_9ACTN|nr:RDD family protein [Planotetraspora silvatica]GII48525.1 hypothetical protein Psi02_49490 [Planotetraspora silvatica]
MTEISSQFVKQGAGFLRRLTAGLIDAVVLSLLAVVLTAFVGDSVLAADDSSTMNPWGTNPSIWALVAAQTLLGVLYLGLTHARWGQTLGKRALKIRVVSLSTGRAPALHHALIRAVFFLGAPLVPFAGWAITLIDATCFGFDGRRQCLHDKLVQTVVIVKA